MVLEEKRGSGKDRLQKELTNEDEIIVFSKLGEDNPMNSSKIIQGKARAKGKGRAVRPMIKNKKFKKTVNFFVILTR